MSLAAENARLLAECVDLRARLAVTEADLSHAAEDRHARIDRQMELESERDALRAELARVTGFRDAFDAQASGLFAKCVALEGLLREARDYVASSVFDQDEDVALLTSIDAALGE